MKRKVLEGSVLFASILKWLFLASGVGIVVGFSTTIFLKLLVMGISYASQFNYYYLLLPFALFFSSTIVQYLAPDAVGHGTEKIIEAVHKYSGRIKPLVVPVKLVATIITITCGGSAGKEGPAAQIGAGACSSFADLLRFNNRDRRKLVICGISAGFATVFGTPIAGAIFGVEVLFVGGLLYEVLFPSFVAGIVGYQISSSLGISYFHEPLQFVPVFSSLFFIKVCLGGLFFGMVCFLFIETLRLFEEASKRIRLWNPLKGFAGGIALILLTLAFSSRYLGLGLDTIKGSLENAPIPAGAFILKMVFTAITLSFGGSGGIITPIFFVGATAGNTFASVLGFDPAIFAAIGLVSVLAGAANTPISASIMSVELFGAAVAPYAAVSCIISFLMTGHRSVYPSQILSVAKSSSLVVAQGKEMGEIGDVAYRPKPESLAGRIIRRMRKAKSDERPEESDE